MDNPYFLSIVRKEQKHTLLKMRKRERDDLTETTLLLSGDERNITAPVEVGNIRISVFHYLCIWGNIFLYVGTFL